MYGLAVLVPAGAFIPMFGIIVIGSCAVVMTGRLQGFAADGIATFPAGAFFAYTVHGAGGFGSFGDLPIMITEILLFVAVIADVPMLGLGLGPGGGPVVTIGLDALTAACISARAGLPGGQTGLCTGGIIAIGMGQRVGYGFGNGRTAWKRS